MMKIHKKFMISLTFTQHQSSAALKHLNSHRLPIPKLLKSYKSVVAFCKYFEV